MTLQCTKGVKQTNINGAISEFFSFMVEKKRPPKNPGLTTRSADARYCISANRSHPVDKTGDSPAQFILEQISFGFRDTLIGA